MNASEKLHTWIEVDRDSDFSILNLPYCIYRTRNKPKYRMGIGFGNYIIDLEVLAALGYFDHIRINRMVFVSDVMNDYIALGKNITAAVRMKVMEEMTQPQSELKALAGYFLDLQNQATFKLPVRIGDYTDFYSSEEHATNVGRLFRDPENALLPNWRHLPVAYHGRASSIGISKEPVVRPWGQVYNKESSGPVFAPTRMLDFEMELAAVIGKSNRKGERVTTEDAEDYIFGFTLFNDWSARDIQRWEYQPLGPFLGKNFTSTMSPWIVPAEALEEVKVDGPHQSPEVFPYLKFEGRGHYDIQLEGYLEARGWPAHPVFKTNSKYLYWNFRQQIAHHTVNGCNMQVGDVIATGTISGKTEDSFGSMLELTYGGKKPLILSNNLTRTFLEDGDRVIFKGYADVRGHRIGFGTLENEIVPYAEI